MRTLVPLVLVASLSPSIAWAAKYGVAGCGLGSLVFKDQSGPIQIVAATLNGTGYQTSGITTGTSNCEQEGMDLFKVSQRDFINTNHASLMRDAAAGSGEYVSALGTLMGCEVAELPRFARVSQARHAFIFDGGAPDDTLERLEAAMTTDKVLRNSCTYMSVRG